MKRTIKVAKSNIGVLLLWALLPLCFYENTFAESPDTRQKIYGVEVQRDTYLKAVRQQIADLKIKIDSLNAKAKKSGRVARLRMEPTIQGFQRDLNDLDKKSMDLKNSGLNAWEELKTDLDASIKKLRTAVDGMSR